MQQVMAYYSTLVNICVKFVITISVVTIFQEFVIDSFVYHYIADWHWTREWEQRSDYPTGTYEKRLYNSCPIWNFNLTAPGSEMPVETSGYMMY